MRRILLLAATHVAVPAVGLAPGFRALPILIAPPAPSTAEVAAQAAAASLRGRFRHDLKAGLPGRDHGLGKLASVV